MQKVCSGSTAGDLIHRLEVLAQVIGRCNGVGPAEELVGIPVVGIPYKHAGMVDERPELHAVNGLGACEIKISGFVFTQVPMQISQGQKRFPVHGVEIDDLLKKAESFS